MQHVPVVTTKTASLKLPAFLVYLVQEPTTPHQQIVAHVILESFQMCLLSMRAHASHVHRENFKAKMAQAHAYHARQDLLLTSLQAFHVKFVAEVSMLKLRGIPTSAILVLVATIKIGLARLYAFTVALENIK